MTIINAIIYRFKKLSVIKWIKNFALYRFFIQDDTKIKMEALTVANIDEHGVVTIHRRFYTFRALWSFVTTEYIINPAIKSWENPIPVLRPFAYAFALIFLLKDIHNVVLIAGAIAYDTTTPQGSSSTPFSFSHTTSGTSRYLIVGAGYGNATTTVPTYNGANMTKDRDDQSNLGAYMYKLFAPASGSNTLTLTPAFANATGCMAISFSGADQTNTVDGSAAGTGSGTGISTGITTAKANTFIVDFCCTFSNPARTVTTGGSQTERANFAQGFVRFAASTRATTTAGSFTNTYTLNSSTAWQHLLIGVPEVTSTAYTKELTEVVTIVDTITKQTSKPLTDAVTLVDTIIKSTARTLVDVVTLVDTVIKATSRAFTEVVTLVDSIVRQTTKVLTDQIVIVDVITTARIYFKELLESVTIVDTIIKQTTRVFTEAVTLVDTFTKQTTKVLTDTVTAVDTFIKQTPRTFTEQITLVDTVTKALSRTFTEAVALVDVVTKSFQKTLTEVVTIVDTITRQISTTYTETVTLVDSVIKTISRELTETVTLVDTFIRSTTKTFVETITLNDAIVKQVQKVLTDTITVVDNFLSALFTKAKKGIIVLLSRGQDKNVIQSKNKDKTIL